MIANGATIILGGILAWITIPISLVTNLLGGCVVSCTFGLILIPLSLIWMVFLGLILGLSWLWERVPWPVQVLIAIVGVPVAAIASAYVLMIPEPEEDDSHRSKSLLCLTFPFEMDLLRYRRLQAAGRAGMLTGATADLQQAMKSLPPYGDPSHAEAWESTQHLYAASLAEFGLDPARYTRITELVYELGERD